MRIAMSNNVYFPDSGVFDQAAIEAMGRAFEIVCRVKPKVSKRLIATKIIELAKLGGRDPAQLSAEVINDLNSK